MGRRRHPRLALSERVSSHSGGWTSALVVMRLMKKDMAARHVLALAQYHESRLPVRCTPHPAVENPSPAVLPPGERLRAGKGPYREIATRAEGVILSTPSQGGGRRAAISAILPRSRRGEWLGPDLRPLPIRGARRSLIEQAMRLTSPVGGSAWGPIGDSAPTLPSRNASTPLSAR